MMKSPSGKRAKFMMALAKQPGLRRLGLSGTPVGQSPLDVWSPYQFLVPGGGLLPPTFSQFRMRYTRPALYSEYRDRDVIITSGRGGELQRWKLRDLDELHERLYRVASRLRTEDVIDQTPATWEELHCTLEPDARRLYSELDREFIAEVQSAAGSASDGHVFTAANAMTKVLHLQQLTGGALRDEDGTLVEVSTAKRDRLAEWLDGVGEEPVVVFARFHHDLDAIHAACARAGLTSSELSGRRAELAAWKAGETQVIAVQEQVGGAGIDLTRARLCVYFSLSYSLLDFAQSKARVRGPAQSRTVAMYALVARGTVDEDIYAALAAGQEVVDVVVDGARRRSVVGAVPTA